MKDLTRRDFLAVAAVVLQGSLVGWSLTTEAQDLNLDDLSDDIGRDYLIQFPSENDVDALKLKLHFEQGSPGQVRRKLSDDIHGDYSAIRTFRYKQWVVSRTEGRLCALKTLL